jgi:hypothetical protein
VLRVIAPSMAPLGSLHPTLYRAGGGGLFPPPRAFAILGVQTGT